MSATSLEYQILHGTADICDDCGGPRNRYTKHHPKVKRCIDCYLVAPRGAEERRRHCLDCGVMLHKGAHWKWENNKRCNPCSKRHMHHLRRTGKRREGDYQDDKGRWHLTGSGEREGTVHGALRNAWWGFKIAKWKNDEQKMRRYAKFINRLEREAGKEPTDFII